MSGFDEILLKTFPDSKQAIDYCHSLSKLYGFTTRTRTSKPDTVYLVCSREGTSNSHSESKSTNSKRCHCGWKITLRKEPDGGWRFQSGNCQTHNHDLNQPEVTEKSKHQSMDVAPFDYSINSFGTSSESTSDSNQLTGLPPERLQILGHMSYYKGTDMDYNGSNYSEGQASITQHERTSLTNMMRDQTNQDSQHTDLDYILN